MSEENKRSIRISVRNLVEFVLRSGDIDNRRSGNAQKDAMLAGGRIHRKIQKRMGSGYRAEVPLKHEVTDDEQEIVLSVEGRADGIFTENGITVIDEIKGMYTDVARLEHRSKSTSPRQCATGISTAATRIWTGSACSSPTAIWRRRRSGGFRPTAQRKNWNSGFRAWSMNILNGRDISTTMS